MRQIRKRWWLALIVVFALGGVAAWWFGFRGRAEGQASLQDVYTVQRGSLVASIAPTGEVYAPRSAALGFSVTRIPLIEVSVTAGQQVKAGDVLARIDPTTLERAVTQAEADLTVAQDNLETVLNPYSELDLVRARLAVTQAVASLAVAQENLSKLQNPDLTTSQAAVRDAAAAIRSAQSQLAIAKDDTSNAAQIRTLEYEAKWYEDNYYAAQAKFSQGKIDQTKLDFEYSNMLAAQERLRIARLKAQASLDSAQSALTKAQESYRKAAAELADLKDGPDAVELEQAKNKVAQAEYDLAKARADLAKMEAGPSAKDIEVARARVTSAQAKLDEAKAALAAATMVAPFDGTVISVAAEVGQEVSSGQTVITLADLTYFRIRAAVSETDIANVQVGQSAVITFDALPGQRFQGKVLEVPLQGSLSQNVLTYQVIVSLEGADGASIKPGMTANLSIEVGRRENALLVPVLAVTQGDTGSIVGVVDSPTGTPVAAPVVTGLSDGTLIEIKRGLNEGDMVVILYQSAQQSDQFFRAGGQGGPMMIEGIRRAP